MCMKRSGAGGVVGAYRAGRAAERGRQGRRGGRAGKGSKSGASLGDARAVSSFKRDLRCKGVVEEKTFLERGVIRVQPEVG